MNDDCLEINSKTFLDPVYNRNFLLKDEYKEEVVGKKYLLKQKQ